MSKTPVGLPIALLRLRGLSGPYHRKSASWLDALSLPITITYLIWWAMLAKRAAGRDLFAERRDEVVLRPRNNTASSWRVC